MHLWKVFGPLMAAQKWWIFESSPLSQCVCAEQADTATPFTLPPNAVLAAQCMGHLPVTESIGTFVAVVALRARVLVAGDRRAELTARRAMSCTHRPPVRFVARPRLHRLLPHAMGGASLPKSVGILGAKVAGGARVGGEARDIAGGAEFHHGVKFVRRITHSPKWGDAVGWALPSTESTRPFVQKLQGAHLCLASSAMPIFAQNSLEEHARWAPQGAPTGGMQCFGHTPSTLCLLVLHSLQGAHLCFSDPPPTRLPHNGSATFEQNSDLESQWWCPSQADPIGVVQFAGQEPTAVSPCKTHMSGRGWW
jgi:hypothetical protein